MLPNPLLWVPMFCNSMSFALDTSVRHRVEGTVNPLAYTIVFELGEKIEGNRLLGFWNCLQKFAHHNEAIPQGKSESEDGRTIRVLVHVKRRIGSPKASHPAE